MTANDFARTAQQLTQLAEQIRPPEGNEYAGGRNVMVYHLRVAAAKARELADAMGEKEKATHA